MTEVLFVTDQKLTAFCEQLVDGTEVLLYTVDGDFLGRLLVREHNIQHKPFTVPTPKPY